MAKVSQTGTPEYRAWSRIKQRCYNPNHNRYKHYGGRGIKVCDEWVHSFLNFYNYIGDRPSKAFSIDRIDVNGNYEPGNVRWADRYQQASNRTNSNKTVGVAWNKRNKMWAAYLAVKNHFVLYRYFHDYQEAVNARQLAEKEYK